MSDREHDPRQADADEGSSLEYPQDSEPSIRVVMMPRDTNALGTIFGGVILSHIDLAAAIEAHKLWPSRVVTVAMDKVEFKQPVFVGDLVTFFTKTERVGRSSIRVEVDVWAHRRFGGGARVPVTEAHVTLVAVDDKLKPVEIPRDGQGRVTGAPG